MCDATYNNSFGLGLTDINEVHRRIDYILNYIFVFFCRFLSDLCVEAFKVCANMTQ